MSAPPPIKCPNCGEDTITYKQWYADAPFTWTCPHCRSILKANKISRVYLLVSFVLMMGTVGALAITRVSPLFVTPATLVVCFIIFYPLKRLAWKFGAGYYTKWQFPTPPARRPQKPEGRLAPTEREPKKR